MYRQTAAEGYMHTDKRMHTYIQLDMHTQGLNYRQTQACVYTLTDARRPGTNILVPAQTERGDTNRQTKTEIERQSRRQTKREEEAKQEK